MLGSKPDGVKKSEFASFSAAELLTLEFGATKVTIGVDRGLELDIMFSKFIYVPKLDFYVASFKLHIVPVLSFASRNWMAQ